MAATASPAQDARIKKQAHRSRCACSLSGSGVGSVDAEDDVAVDAAVVDQRDVPAGAERLLGRAEIGDRQAVDLLDDGTGAEALAIRGIVIDLRDEQALDAVVDVELLAGVGIERRDLEARYQLAGRRALVREAAEGDLFVLGFAV